MSLTPSGIDFLPLSPKIMVMSHVIPAPALTVTPAAAKRILEIGGVGKAALRVAVNGGGCSGFQYEFKLDATRAEDDLSFEHNGATVVVDAISLEIVAGSTLDFVDDLMGQSFRMQNPKAKSSCGCGTSFSF